MSINTVTLIGRVGKDAETRTVGQSKKASFSLCTGSKRKSNDGKEYDDTMWHNIVTWKYLADFAEKYVRKGTQLAVIGKLAYRKYTDSNGVERQMTEIVADRIELCGGRQDRIESKPQIPEGTIGNMDNDLPF